MPGTGYADVLSSRVPPRRHRGISGAVGRGTLSALTVAVGVLGGLGWIYALREQGWLGSGPSVGDALPLLQLASFDRQPLARIVAAWLLAGLITGLVLAGGRRVPRVALAGGLAVALLWLDSEASHAVARNLRFDHVIAHRWPGAGTWLGAALFTLGCALPGGGPRRGGPVALPGRGALGSSGEAGLGGGDLGLSGGQRRHAGQHHRDRPKMGGDGDPVAPE